MSIARAFSLYKPKIQMQTLAIMDMVVIKDYYHMTTMDEDMNWMKSTLLLSYFPPNLRAPFRTSTFTPNFFIFFFEKYTIKKNYASPLSILCTLMLQMPPLFTPMLVRTWYEDLNEL